MPTDTQATAQNRPEPSTMRGVIPSIGLNGRASEAADFSLRAFGAREIGRMPDADNPGRLIHLHLEINGGGLMMTDHCGPGEAARQPQGFSL